MPSAISRRIGSPSGIGDTRSRMRSSDVEMPIVGRSVAKVREAMHQR